jgi:hypothetical protein
MQTTVHAAVEAIGQTLSPLKNLLRKPRTLISFFEVKTRISLTVALEGPESIPHCQRFRKMLIELALFVAIVAAMGATVVKIYEWRQDVLYGPYLARERVEQKRRR